MSEHRPFPPSPRRAELARRAGLSSASPQLVAAAAWLGALVALVTLARGVATHLGEGIATACTRLDGDPAAAASSIARSVIELSLPLLAACAIVASTAHLAQNRAAWMPRRRLRGAPALPRDAGARGRRAMFELASGVAFGGVALGWLWAMAPRIARLVELDPDTTLAAGAALVASAVAALATAWIITGALDLLLRTAERTSALRMTAAEKREDERLTGADPRWRERRRAAAAAPSAAAVMPGATLLLLGDTAAVAIAWDAIRRPIPTRVAIGRGARATQLLGLARRHGVPVHRDAVLAATLAGDDGAVPRDAWPRLAEIVAALRR